MAVRRVSKQAFTLVAGAAFTSGALAIALEMILMRLATRYTGSAADGTTTALTAYLLGLLAGAALVMRLNNKNGATHAYAPVATLVSLALLGSGLGYLSKLPTDSLWLVQYGSGLPFCILVILLPACLAGAIFPLLLLICTNFYVGSREAFADSAGESNINQSVVLLYLLSNLGSALGALASAIWLLPRLGIAQSLNFVGLGWIVVALLLAPLAVASRSQGSQQKDAKENAEPDEIEVDASEAIVSTSRPFTYISVFCAALAGLLFECLAVRMLGLLCGASFISTACAVAATLLAIALGSRIALFLPTHKNTRLTLALALSLATAGIAMTVLLLPHLNNVFQAVRQLTLAEFSEAEKHGRWLAYVYPRLILALIFCLPGATGLSLVFPVAAKSASRPVDMLRLYIAGGCGTALAPLVFIGSIGHVVPTIPSSMELMLRAILIALIALAVAALTDHRLRGKKAREAIFSKLLCLTATTVALIVLFFSRPLPLGKIDLGLPFVSAKLSVRDVEADEKLHTRLFYKEGRTATISVLADENNNSVSLRSDGKVEGTVPINFDAPAPASDLPTQSLLALLPLIWRDQQKSARSCFLIGYGTGTTAATILKATPTMKLRVAEIEPAVLQAGRYFKENAAAVSPSALTTGDARQMLQDSNVIFDLIISQPAEPWVHGSTNLYSSEFYQLVKSRLIKGGTFCQWLQLYGMDKQGMESALTTFQSVFPHCLVFHPKGAGEVIVLGFNLEHEASAADVMKNFLLPANGKLFARAGIDSFGRLKSGVLLTTDSLAQAVKQWRTGNSGVIEVSDDNLALELNTVPEIESGARPIQANLELLKNLGNPADQK